jgi:hypothetical protein
LPVALSLCACDAQAPPPETRTAAAPLDVRGDVVLLGLGPAVRAESDALPSRDIVRVDTHSSTRLAIRTRATWAALGEHAVFVVSPERELVRVDGSGERVLLDRAHGKPAPRSDGSVVVARVEGPGETDLWLVSASGSARAVDPAPGPDDSPIALPDGRIAFVSGRSTVSSLFVLDPNGGPAVQLTNRGLRAGKPRIGFVPPPLHVLEASSTSILYDAGGGAHWRVSLVSGQAERLGGPP